jgi:hypothetical protein
MTRRNSATLATAAMLLALGACRDRDADSARDSALSRDLTLAAAIARPTPELRDVPDPTPAPEPEVRRTPVPVRAPVRAAPRERPRPVVEAPTPPVEAPAPEPTPAPAPAPRTGVIAAGTSFGLTTDDRACSDANRPGDKMVARTAEPVTGTNGVVFPAGSPVVIEVASVTPGSTADSSTITFRVRSITADGVTHAVTGDVVPTGTLEKRRIDTGGSDKKKVVGGAILGAVLGRVAGGGAKGTVIGAAAGAAVGAAAAGASARYETCVPAGATLRLTISAPIDVGL